MKIKYVAWNLVLIIFFGVLSLTQFIEGVDTIKIIGLFSGGAVVGNSFANIYHLLKRSEY